MAGEVAQVLSVAYGKQERVGQHRGEAAGNWRRCSARRYGTGVLVHEHIHVHILMLGHMFTYHIIYSMYIHSTLSTCIHFTFRRWRPKYLFLNSAFTFASVHISYTYMHTRTHVCTRAEWENEPVDCVRDEGRANGSDADGGDQVRRRDRPSGHREGTVLCGLRGR